MKWASLRLCAFVAGLVWSFGASALTGVEVPLNSCVTNSGVAEPSPPYYGGEGPSPTSWAAATQLSCIRYAAAHRSCSPGNICTDGTVCSSVVACNLTQPPFTSSTQFPSPFGSSTAFLEMQDNLASCPHFVGGAGGTCGCPANSQLWTDGRCYCNDGRVWNKAANSCVVPQECGSSAAGSCNPTAIVPGKNCTTCPKRGDVTAGSNPVDVGTGMKIERDLVYRSVAGNALSLELMFVSGNALAPMPEWVGLFGRNRTSPFDRAIRIVGVIDNQFRIVLVKADGRHFEFRGPTTPSTFAPDEDVEDRIELLSPAGWKVTASEGDQIELYDVGDGPELFRKPLLAVADRAGRTQRLSYADGAGGVRYAAGSPGLGFSFTAPACAPPAGWVYQIKEDGTSAGNPSFGRLLCVTDHWGRQLHFQHDAQGRVVKMADPAGQVYEFKYDEASGGCSPFSYENPACTASNLTSILFPDGKLRRYHYNEVSAISGGAACPGTTPFSSGRGHLPSHLTSVEDENGGLFARWTYDCEGRATSSEHAGGANKITVAYGGSGQSTVSDFRVDTNTPNQSRTYSFLTSLGVVRNTGVSQPCDYCGNTASAITYDANGNISSRTDFNGKRTNYTYDLARNLETSRTEGLISSGGTTPATRTISTQWHWTFRLPTGIAEPLRITTFVYDLDGSQCGARGALCSRTIQATSDANGSQDFSATPIGAPRTWTYTYNSSGNVLTANGPRTDVADTTAYTYYPDSDPELGKRGNVASISNAAGHLISITAYNAHGQPLTIVDPNGITTTLTYDARQRLKTRTVGNETTTYDYDGVGQSTKVTLPDGSFLSYTYDPAHRLTDITDNLGNRIAYTLDLLGNRIQERVFDPANQLAQTRSRVFNNLNRLFRELGAQSQTTEYTYDDQGNVITVKDPLNRITTNQYDALNRLEQVTSPAPISAVTQYAYNGLDALTSVTDPRNLVTGYALDGLGNLNVQTSPDTGTTTNTHDAAGNLLTQIDARSQTTTYAYDALNRVTLITFHDGSKQAYAYDQGANGIGRLVSIAETNPANQVTSVIAYGYDLHGRVTSVTRTVAGVQYALGYRYDSTGRLDQLTYPSGRTVNYSFDGLGRVSAVISTKLGEQAKNVVTNITYHPFGGIKGYTLGNGQVYARGIDLDGRIASYTLGAQSYAIGYDAASRIIFISEIANPVNTNTYGYDEIDRLIGAVLPGTPYAYTYDAVGNRTSRTAGSSTHNYTYSNTSNRIASITPTSGPVRNFLFAPNGSTTADGINTYLYDTRGRMVQATSAIGATNYQVNALGQRIRKTNIQTDRVFHYDTQGRLIAETDPGGALKRELFYLGDTPVAVFQ
jgi:YD repeat-containing protein